MAYQRHDFGAAAGLADGGTITHKLGKTPTLVNLTPTVAGTVLAVTAKTSTSITVAVKTWGLVGSLLSLVTGTTQTVHWEVAC